MGVSWRLIQTRPGFENRVADALKERLGKARDGDVYVPSETVWRRLGHRKVPTLRPLIRGYVFVALADPERAIWHEIEGASGMIGSAEPRDRLGDGSWPKPALAPERVGVFVGTMLAAERAGVFDATKSERARRQALGARRQVGDQVRVTLGPFKGFVGSVMKLKGDRRVQVMFAVLGTPLPVDVRLAILEPAPEAEPVT